MKKHFFIYVSIIGLMIITFYPSVYAQKTKTNSTSQVSKSTLPLYLNTSYSFRERAADLVSRMTLGEEVLQLHTNYAPAIPRLGVSQYYYWSEGQHGINAMFGNIHHGNSKKEEAYGSPHATSFPVNFATAMSWDPKLIYREAEAISDEARGFVDKSLFNVGQNNLGDSKDNYGNLIYWAPTINMDRDPRWGRTDEAFGEDTYLASRMAAAFVDGFQGQTINGESKTGYLKAAATAKHYALNDIENNRTGISSDVNDEAIRDYYTATFRYLIEKAHVAGLMTSYNAINGTPAVANTYTVNELAQRTFGFDGYITSDCGAIGTTYNTFPFGHDWAAPGWMTDHQGGGKSIWTNTKSGRVVSGISGGLAYALRAGTDLNCTGYENTLPNIEEAIKAGVLSKGVVDIALTNVFTIRMKTGEFDPSGKVPYTKITKSVIQSPDHQKLAEEVAENTLVLLKNDTVPGMHKCLLPMNASKLNKVVIVGNLANEVTLGGYSGDPSLKVSAVQGITSAMKEINPNSQVIFDNTGTSTTSENPALLSEKTKSDIKSADLVIVFAGTDEADSHEGKDRADLGMPGNYGSMIYQVAALGNPNMVMVIQSVGPVNISYTQHYFPSILFSSYNGESQGTALANVLLGKKNPSGHLNFTWYKDATQLPDKSNYYLAPTGAMGSRGLGRTYMYFTGTPSYPFGYGLSYTQFKFSNITLSKSDITPNDSVMVSFDVTNTGNTSGETVAQLYVAFPRIKGAPLPIKKLEGFAKTEDLQPGQSQHITLTLTAANLALWNEKELKSMVYNGAYQIQLGYNSQDIASSNDVNIQGELTSQIEHVTLQPEQLVYPIGATVNLMDKNKWIESDIIKAREERHAVADRILEAVNNDGSFVDLSKVHIHYQSNNPKVAKVNDAGVVKAVGTGVATITATINGVSGSMVMVVK
ncbi:glycoside hydrolase family 3 C-terminal domain-containing protein [Microbacter margulisiae]|uniref:Beta-glucosidase-like glycosyl hydrolase n=1 Tax=Microbacter margulisiae TaxID=1350067 RepID=A0A7W5DSH6_9PORP|nr:glycoside hydrolase family 3 C-terminal domain-containing protein [Microbacter margulisiae]MBB3188101.1 beta-glucosidase-like glycosyl hydrolase [Microbacter margulisiae]